MFVWQRQSLSVWEGAGATNTPIHENAHAHVAKYMRGNV